MELRCSCCGMRIDPPHGKRSYVELRTAIFDTGLKNPHYDEPEPAPKLPSDVVLCNLYCLSVFMKENAISTHAGEPARWPTGGQYMNGMPHKK